MSSPNQRTMLIINNYSASRIDYAEVPTTSFQLETLDTPPGTPLSSRSLPVNFMAPSLSKMKSEPSRRRTYKQLEECEMTEMKTKLRNKERKGER